MDGPWLIPLVALSITVVDLLYTALTGLIASGRITWASLFHALADLLSALTVVGGATAALNDLVSGHVLLGLGYCAAIVVGAWMGTQAGSRLERLIERRTGRSLPTRRRLL